MLRRRGCTPSYRVRTWWPDLLPQPPGQTPISQALGGDINEKEKLQRCSSAPNQPAVRGGKQPQLQPVFQQVVNKAGASVQPK